MTLICLSPACLCLVGYLPDSFGNSYYLEQMDLGLFWMDIVPGLVSERQAGFPQNC